MNKIQFFKRIIFFTFLLNTTVNAQKVGISLVKTESGLDKNVCFEIRLKNFSENPVNLADQNYRIYYNAESTKLNERSIMSKLGESYSPIKLVQHFHNVDATGYGRLTYEGHLGFINLAIAFDHDSKNEKLMLPDKEVTIASLCFETETPDKPLEINWAHHDITYNYAHALVVMTLYDANRKENALYPAEIVEYSVETRSDEKPSIVPLDVKFYPNPFSELLTIVFSDPLRTESDLKVTNLSGMLLHTAKLSKGILQYNLSGNQLPEGALLIEIKSENEQTSVIRSLKVR